MKGRRRKTVGEGVEGGGGGGGVGVSPRIRHGGGGKGRGGGGICASPGGASPRERAGGGMDEAKWLTCADPLLVAQVRPGPVPTSSAAWERPLRGHALTGRLL